MPQSNENPRSKFWEHQYPSLHIMVSDNPRSHEGRLCLGDVDKAIEKISAWLREKMRG